MSCEWHSAPIFVYGTLKRGLPNHYLFTNQGSNSYAFVGNAVTTDKWPLVIGTPYNIPFLLDCCGIGNRVTGELYRVNGTVLNFLDELEGHPGYYTRTAISVEVIKTTSDGSKTASYVNHNGANTASEVIQCEVYLLPNFKKDLLKLDYLDCYFENSAKKYVPGSARPIGALSGKSLVKDI